MYVLMSIVLCNILGLTFNCFFIVDLMALKEDKEVLNETEEKYQFENLHNFITGEKSLCCSQSEKTSTPEEAQKTSHFTCFECGKSFRFKGSLKRHMMLHTGDKPYTCLQCGKRFSIQQNLTYHLRVHTGERPFTCEQCGSSFIQKVCLNRHMRIHTGEKPFTCQQCGERFTQPETLKPT